MSSSEFFFSRGDADARHLGKFVTSIAFQLTEYSDALKDSINECIMDSSGEDDDIWRNPKDWRYQWDKLIRGGIYHSRTNLNSRQPLIIIIDALDECDGEDHDIRELIIYLSGINSPLHREAVRLRFFITSRPSNQMRAAFDRMSVTYYESLILDDNSNFMEIVPCEGQPHLPLDIITSVDAQTETPREIYSTFLRNCSRYCCDKEERARLDFTPREILNTSLVLFAPLPISALAEIIERSRSSIQNILSNLRPLGLSFS
ncbi:hypothetical protein N7540_008607 [Penicillium herquei]|nr:hypothetical protein N7540_008607 [Penicillium herquei]